MVDFADVITNTLFWTTRDQGGPDEVYLKDPRFAAEFFGLRDTSLLRTPRGKFLFFVNFMRPERVGLTSYGDWYRGVPFLIKQIQRPGIQFQTDTLNQYNKKRVVQRRLDYEPIQVTFYDTYDQRVMTMLREYFNFYYGDFNASVNNRSWNYDVTEPVFFDSTGNSENQGVDWGFKTPLGQRPNESYFFDRIEFYQYGYSVLNKFSLINPKIASFDYDDHNYGEGADPQTITLRLAYEGIVFEGNQNTYDNVQDTEFGAFSKTHAGVAPVRFPGDGATNPDSGGGFFNRVTGHVLKTFGDIATGQITPEQALDVAVDTVQNPFWWTSQLPPLRFNRQNNPTIGGFNPNAPVRSPTRGEILGSTNLTPVNSGSNFVSSASQRKKAEIYSALSKSATSAPGNVVDHTGCRFPDDRASDGSRCGRRAASVRPGGWEP